MKHHHQAYQTNTVYPARMPRIVRTRCNFEIQLFVRFAESPWHYSHRRTEAL